MQTVQEYYYKVFLILKCSLQNRARILLQTVFNFRMFTGLNNVQGRPSRLQKKQ